MTMQRILQKLQAIAQEGNTYAKDPFDRIRYDKLQKIILELAQEALDFSPVKASEIFLEDKGYRTPKVDVRAAIFNEQNQVLLVQEKNDGKWSMPGGWADVGETPTASVVREVYEESNLEVRVDKLIAIHDSDRHKPGQLYHSYKMIFLCHVLRGQIGTSIETADVKYFDVNRLPELSQFRINEQQIQIAYKHFLVRSLMTELD